MPGLPAPRPKTVIPSPRRLSLHGGVKVTILHAKPPQCDENASQVDLARIVEGFAPDRVRLKAVEHEDLVEAAVRQAWMGYDLIVAGASEVTEQKPALFARWHERLAFATAASLLVVQGRRSATPEQSTSSAHLADAAA